MATRLQFFLHCRDVVDRDGTYDLRGVFDRLGVAHIPTEEHFHTMVGFSGMAKGKQRMSMRCVWPDGGETEHSYTIVADTGLTTVRLETQILLDATGRHEWYVGHGDQNWGPFFLDVYVRDERSEKEVGSERTGVRRARGRTGGTEG